MGTEYGVNVSVGFTVDPETVEKVLEEKYGDVIVTPEVRTPHYSSATGERLPDKVVAGTKSVVFLIGGIEWDNMDNLIMEEGLNEILGCMVHRSVNHHDYVETPIIFALDSGLFKAIERTDTDFDWGRLSVGSGFQIQSFEKLEQACEDLRKRLEDFGFERLGRPQIILDAWLS